MSDTTEQLKEQFKNGPTQPPTAEQLQQMREEEIAKMEQQLPYMRMKEEYNRLTISLYEQGVQLGTMRTVNEKDQLIIGGILGVDLFLKEKGALNELYHYKQQLEEGIRRQQEATKEQAPKAEETV